MPKRHSELSCGIPFGNQQSPNNTIFPYKNSGLACGIRSEPNNRQTIRFSPLKFRTCLWNVAGNEQSPNNTISPIKIRDLPVEFCSETNNTISPYKFRDLLVNSVRKPTIVKQYDFSSKSKWCGLILT